MSARSPLLAPSCCVGRSSAEAGFVRHAALWQTGALYPSGPPLQGTGPDAYTPSVGTPHATWCGLAALTTESETTTVAVKIRLKRMGKIRTAIYRVVVMDSRTKRDGRAIEEIGKYDPNQEPSLIEIDMERADYWVAQGAQPTEAVAALLSKYRDGTLKVAEAPRSKKDLYEAAVAAAGGTTDDTSSATTPKKRAAKKAEEPKTDEAPAEEESAEAPAADTDSGEAAAEGTDADADASAESAVEAKA
jgi:small subunit ribosomal protein S16